MFKMKSIFFENFLFFIVLLNPVSKIIVLSSLGVTNNFNELKKYILKSNHNCNDNFIPILIRGHIYFKKNI